MTRRKPRITTVEEARAALPKLQFLRYSAPQVQLAVRDLLDCCAVFEADIYRLEKLLGQDGKPGWTDRISKSK